MRPNFYHVMIQDSAATLSPNQMMERDLVDFLTRFESRFVLWDGRVDWRAMSCVLTEESFRQYINRSRLLRQIRRVN